MVNVTLVQTLHHEVPWEPKILTHLQCFLVYQLGGKVFCNATVVNIAELGAIILIVEQIVHIDIVDVALNTRQINLIILLASITLFTCLCLPIALVTIFIRLSTLNQFICFVIALIVLLLSFIL